MVAPSFSIECDPAGPFLHLSLVGDWNRVIADRFATEVAGGIRGMIAAGALPGTFLTLIDMSRKNILPQDIATDMARMLRPDSPSRRIAFVVSGSLHLLQARRLCESEGRRCFPTEEVARQWLFAD